MVRPTGASCWPTRPISSPSASAPACRPFGPGTAGTLAGLAAFPFVKAPLSDPLFAALLVACFLFGVIACERTGAARRGRPRRIVWDEIVPIWLVLWLTPPRLAWQVRGLLPVPLLRHRQAARIRWVDEHTRGGFGVMLDDSWPPAIHPCWRWPSSMPHRLMMTDPNSTPSPAWWRHL